MVVSNMVKFAMFVFNFLFLFLVISVNTSAAAKHDANTPTLHHDHIPKQLKLKSIFWILRYVIIKQDLSRVPRLQPGGDKSTDGKNEKGLKLLLHNIVKRHAAPDPRPQPKGGGPAKGKVEERYHESLFVRKELKVNPTGVVFTAIALILVFALICILLYCYWK